jgi:hypothetical protein
MKEGERFFSEKKKQKTFLTGSADGAFRAAL